jgi:protein-disulfide isomerase
VKRSGFETLVLAGGLLGLGLLGGQVARARFAGVEVVGPIDTDRLVAREAGMAVGPVRGVPVLRVFGDYECPACRSLERAAGDTLRALARRGRIRFVYHHAPLRTHHRGERAAALAYCAQESGSPWVVHAALFESLPGPGIDGAARTALDAAVRTGAAGPTKGLAACLDSERTATRIAADRAAAGAIGLTEVPTLIFGDQRVRARSWRALVRWVTARSAAS